MQRHKVKSSAAHSVGHDHTGMEVQFHSRTCATKMRNDPGLDCDCEGGDIHHYETVTKDIHAELMSAVSFGSHFQKHIRPFHRSKQR